MTKITNRARTEYQPTVSQTVFSKGAVKDEGEGWRSWFVLFYTHMSFVCTPRRRLRFVRWGDVWGLGQRSATSATLATNVLLARLGTSAEKFKPVTSTRLWTVTQAVQSSCHFWAIKPTKSSRGLPACRLAVDDFGYKKPRILKSSPAWPWRRRCNTAPV